MYTHTHTEPCLTGCCKQPLTTVTYLSHIVIRNDPFVVIHLTITFVTYQLYFAGSPEKGEIWELHKHPFQVDDHNGREHSLKHSTSTHASPLVSISHCLPAALPTPFPCSSDGTSGAKNTWIFRTWLAKMGLGKQALRPSSKLAWWSRGSELNLVPKELFQPRPSCLMIFSVPFPSSTRLNVSVNKCLMSVGDLRFSVEG